MRVGFGQCVFDAEARELTRDGAAVQLSPKAFQLLSCLLEHRPRAVSRTELHDLIWPRVFVSYTSLPRLVTELRRALADRSRLPRFVRTVHGYGYAFTGQDVRELPERVVGARSRCSLRWGKRKIRLLEGETLIGRGPDCGVQIDSTLVSRHHARIRVAGGNAILEDCQSKNGSFVEGKRVKESVSLEDGDTIKVGPAVLVFLAGGQEPSDSTATGDIEV
jgi:DNA-binding winged helix-turn-helix (wHTH) protein